MLAFVIVITFGFVASGSSLDTGNNMARNLPKTMRAVGLYKYLPISEAESLVDLEIPVPTLQKTDVLIEVKAVSVNPIDTKIRAPKPTVEKNPRILGWDGSGIVVAKGDDTKHFNVGDEVFFTGDLRKNGANAQYVALNEVMVGVKPKNLTFEQAAAMPLTSVTAFESLFDRLLITEKDKGKTLLIINSAGGVGSVASQLAKNFGLKVIGTASRPETVDFSKRNGADIVLNHTQDLLPQLQSHGYEKGVDLIMVNYDPYPYWDTIMKAAKPQGRICLIVDSSGLIDLKPIKEKSLTITAEMMATRIYFETEDMYRHHEILNIVSQKLDKGELTCTLNRVLSPINAANLKEAHKLLESKSMIGKLVLSGF
ncbi:zinc-type alcohol dehydrogenase-like protein SERP1785 [Plodia interpunctella]|uniref:zinc-type alcohol dehydrogenase-like protein SERP1785 n=1 Tax=Plodia interpunctella TaxID=58824 RepID=UPI002367557E|nr:zinc-type alcohol dehydrogenase-like protein SERP1785 [Plodia interpunctella]XP_053607775.1 zinc-type alcohol dehydrogenase-like protein SERP1785 [Plodia interpunctella]XP_053607777.1 zinc-type alcohol dehydrogenase-like protein SERP1785 [Plodia interpunctella]XP_053607778.1 zinc-type alcohol dehydrogenase-like protein SERP1785 [Plodia interpunctella]XP_053607779.1 zinc-type alcohol dehydrogenase-like protein SERP1785 [Plodia interpunctella]